MRLTKILLPVDFSEQGDAAAQQAAAKARHFHAGLILLHVNPILISALTPPGEFSGPIDRLRRHRPNCPQLEIPCSRPDWLG